MNLRAIGIMVVVLGALIVGAGFARGGTLSREGLLKALRSAPSFARVDLVVEYPFGDRESWVTLAGCVPNRDDARRARRTLYQLGADVVLDRLSVTPGSDSTPGYVDAVCGASWLHDGRRVARWLMTPYVRNPKRESLDFITDAAHRSRVSDAIDTSEDLQSLGVSQLASAVDEVYKQLTLWKSGVYDPESLVERTEMVLEVWARLPHQDVKGESLTKAEWQQRERAGLERFKATHGPAR